MSWESLLQPGEELRWQGRPQPRCYTFRNWKHALIGLLLLLLASWWEAIALQLEAVNHYGFLYLIPLPFWLFGLYLGIGQLLKSRLEWEHLFYAATDRRLLVRRGRKPQLRELTLDSLRYFRFKPLGTQLGSLLVIGADDRQRLRLNCIEHPRQLTDLLEDALRRNGVLAEESV